MSRIGALVLALLSLLVLTAAPAAAHAELIASDPTDGAQFDMAPERVALTFNQNVAPDFATVVVTGPDGTSVVDGAAVVDGPVVSVALLPLTASGTYTVAYRVVSADGHPVEGKLGFEFTMLATSSAQQAPVPQESPQPAAAPPAPDRIPW